MSSQVINRSNPSGSSRCEPQLFYHIREEDKLLNVHGVSSPMLIKFSVSNDWVHVGEFILPTGGINPRASEPDTHAGDAVLYVERGPVTFFLPDTTDAFKVEAGEAMFVPEGTRYQMINYTAGAIKVVFAIAPEL